MKNTVISAFVGIILASTYVWSQGGPGHFRPIFDVGDFLDSANTVTIATGSIEEGDLDAAGTPASGDVLTYDGTSASFTWATQSSLNVGNATNADSLANDPSNCSTTTHFAVGVAASGAAECEAIVDDDVPNNLTIAGGTIGTSEITLTQSATPTPTDEGVIEWDTDDDHIYVGTNGGTAVFVPAAGVGGDITMGNDGVTTITANSIVEADLAATNTPSVDGEVLTYDSATSAFTWATQGSLNVPTTLSILSSGLNVTASNADTLDFGPKFSLNCPSNSTTCDIGLNSSVYDEGDTAVPTSANSLPATGTWSSTNVIITHGNFEAGALEIPYGTSSSLPTDNGGIYYKTNQTPQPMLSVRDNVMRNGVGVNVPIRACSIGRAFNAGIPAPTHMGWRFGGSTADVVALIAPQNLTISNLTCKSAEDFASGEDATFTFKTAQASSCVAGGDGAAAGCSFSSAANMNCTITDTGGFSDNSCQPTAVSTASVSINENDRYAIEITASNFPSGNAAQLYCTWIECLDEF